MERWEWKQWDYLPNGCPYVREEARIAEVLAGESRKLADDEAGDFLRKAREPVSGSRGALQHSNRLYSCFGCSGIVWVFQSYGYFDF